MPYLIEFVKSAEKELSKLPQQVQANIKSKILSLADEPRPVGVKKLTNSEDFYRIRVGDYRIIYTLEDHILTVVIIKIRHRREAYK